MVAPESAGAGAQNDAAGKSPGVNGDVEATPAEESFVRGLLARGEAAKAVDGKLPPGVTHEIVEERPGRLPRVVRRRFS